MGKSQAIVGVVAAAVLLTWSFATDVRADDSKAAITQMEHKCAGAKTADELMGCYEKTNDLVVYDLMTPREFDGRDAVRADFQNGFNAFKDAKVEFINLHVVSDGNLGVAESVQHMTATDSAGKPIDMIFRVTDVWRKDPDGWKIIHSHISVPMDVATGKADLESK